MGEDKIWGDDRRADRISIMGPLQKDDRRFIILQIGNGELYFDGQKTLLQQVSGKARLTETYTATKTKDTCKVKEIYDYGGHPSEVNRGEEAVMAYCAQGAQQRVLLVPSPFGS